MVEVRLLGPVQVRAGDEVVEVGAPQRSLVFAALSVDAGRLVSTDTLIDRVWGQDPARGARRTAQTHLAVIRGLFRAAGLAVPLVHRRGGYLLDIEPGQVDIHRFRHLAARAGQPDHPAAERAGLWREAVEAWHGEPLLALPGEWAARTRQAWWQEHRDAVLGWAHAEIQLDRPTVVIGPLTDLVDRYPLAEAPPATLMRALYAAGRRQEALDCYAAVTKRLDDELAERPGPELRAVYQAVLRRDTDPLAPPSAPAPAVGVPALLPADTPAFAGRGGELAELDRLLAGIGKGPGAVVISAIGGAPGVGKTALAVHWARRVAARFPDGQLYVNLRGFDPAGTLLAPAEALRRFLHALDVPARRIPPDPDAQADLYRTLLAGRTMLIVLDNARDAEQVRPLLPGAPGCLTLVTSRNRLAGLVATDGARSLPLDVLTDGEARDLLTRRLGAERATAEPEAVDEIVARCAGLPLALAIVAANAATQPRLPLATLAEQLRTADRRIDALSTGDTPSTDLRAVFSWSYRALGQAAARLFRLLGLHPGPDISAPAAASLAAVPVDRVRPLLAELTRAHLVVEHLPGRFTFHDLLRAYAHHLAHTTDPDHERRAATHRMLDHYLHTADAADQQLHPHRDPITLTPPQPGSTPETLTDHDAAIAWLTAEHPVLLAAVNHAAAHGFDTHTWQLAWTLGDFLDRRGHWHDWTATGAAAVAATDRLADPAAQASATRYLAVAYTRLGRVDEAQALLRHSLDLSLQTGDQIGQAHTHLRLSVLCEWQDRYAEALDHAERALHLYQATGHQRGQAYALNAAGWDHACLGDHRQARTHCRRALTLFQQFGDRAGQAAAWDSLGYAHHHLGEHTEAVTCYEHAIDLVRQLGDRYHVADGLTHLGDTHHATGDLDAARDAWQQALTILDQLDHPDADRVRHRLDR